MSFILDALKKSEVERQRQSAPSLMESAAPAPRPRFPLWAIALVALLAINLAVLAIVLTRSAAPAPVPAAAAPPVQSAPAAALQTPQHFSPLDAAPVYAPEIPADAGSASSAPAPPAVLRAPSAMTPPPLRAPRERDPTLTANEDKSDQEVLPTINELSLAGRQALPDLHLDVHVFATKPAERFVYINMRKYHEGATLAEGPVIERIRRDGVVLNFQGVRFVLPRQQ
jgi:general secretion pathway protein B